MKRKTKKESDFLESNSSSNDNHKSVFSQFISILYKFIIPILFSSAALVISYQALQLSQLTVKTSSKMTEPIISIEIDDSDDSIIIRNETNEIYQILHVNFGHIYPICVTNSEYTIIYAIEIPRFMAERSLERGETTGTDTSPEEAKKENISMEINREKWDYGTDSHSLIENVRLEIAKQIKSDTDLYLHENYYPYYYVQIFYKDTYGNRNVQYYIYQPEYGSVYQLYKMSKDDFYEYTKYVVNENNKPSSYYSELLFSDVRTYTYNETKYARFYYYDRYNPFP